MPATDDLLHALWQSIERTADVERELRTTADELAAWRQIAQAACTALDRELARSRKDDDARTIA